MTSLIPSMLEELSIFKDVLGKYARNGDMFSLDQTIINATMDVIGKVALGHNFNSQLEYNDMTAALRNQIRWFQFGSELNILDRLNPLRPILQWYNSRIMDHYLSEKLHHRYARGDTAIETNSKTIIDLALKSYYHDLCEEKSHQTIDSTFHQYAISQTKLFIFGGHDTTAATVCYLYLLLSRNAAVLGKLRSEHDSVLGLDPNKASSMLASHPHLLNQLPYTLAVIKETLRLFPAVTSPRAGMPGHLLTDKDGRQYPTEYCMVWSVHHGLHNDPLFWPQVEEFLPERFLVEEGHPLHPIKNAWRPFETGPRNCIGQELAMTELKLVLAMTIREFEITEAYEEWDTLRGERKGVKTVNGERAYQIQMGSARPSNGFPTRVKLRRKTE